MNDQALKIPSDRCSPVVSAGSGRASHVRPSQLVARRCRQRPRILCRRRYMGCDEKDRTTDAEASRGHRRRTIGSRSRSAIYGRVMRIGDR